MVVSPLLPSPGMLPQGRGGEGGATAPTLRWKSKGYRI